MRLVAVGNPISGFLHFAEYYGQRQWRREKKKSKNKTKQSKNITTFFAFIFNSPTSQSFFSVFWLLQSFFFVGENVILYTSIHTSPSLFQTFAFEVFAAIIKQQSLYILKNITYIKYEQMKESLTGVRMFLKTSYLVQIIKISIITIRKKSNCYYAVINSCGQSTIQTETAFSVYTKNCKI